MTDLKLNLYENGIDSIRHAIEHYTDDPVEERRYKYAVLHLAQGVSLLLKERLSLEHPNFVFSGLTNSDKTIDTKRTILLLRKIADVQLADDDEKTLKELFRTRNAIEHYEVELKKATVDSLIARTVTFLVWFVSEELGKHFKSEIGSTTWQALQKIETYRQHAINQAKALILAQGFPAHHCPSCNDQTATIEEESLGSPWSNVDIDTPTIYRITCKACLETFEEGYYCRECGRDIPVAYPGPTIYRDKTYCNDCKTKLAAEFPGFERATYVAEVRRWFRTHDKINLSQLLALVTNVSMHGPTGSTRYPKPLVERGVIDFADKYQRKRYERRKRALEGSTELEHYDLFQSTGFVGDEEFVWVWDKVQQDGDK